MSHKYNRRFREEIDTKKDSEKNLHAVQIFSTMVILLMRVFVNSEHV